MIEKLRNNTIVKFIKRIPSVGFFLLMVFFLYHCSPKRTAVQSTFQKTEASATIDKIDGIVDTALTYMGTPYKYGGTTTKGMDCSGLVFKSFTTHNVSLNRSSYEIAKQGNAISLEQVQRGDLLFFQIGKSNRINHVGLVTSVTDKIWFIHATTSRGVLISSMDEKYWKESHVKTKRIL